jgi:hypothetical protein
VVKVGTQIRELLRAYTMGIPCRLLAVVGRGQYEAVGLQGALVPDRTGVGACGFAGRFADSAALKLAALPGASPARGAEYHDGVVISLALAVDKLGAVAAKRGACVRCAGAKLAAELSSSTIGEVPDLRIGAGVSIALRGLLHLVGCRIHAAAVLLGGFA